MRTGYMTWIVAAALALLAASGFAQPSSNPYAPAGCTGTVVPINGVVTSTPVSPNDPDPDVAKGCRKAVRLGDVASPDGALMPLVCLKIVASGTAKASGYSVLTSVPVASLVPDPDPDSVSTPFCFPGDATRGGCPSAPSTTAPSPETSAGLQGFTSQAALRGSVLEGQYRGTIYTKDTGYITADGFVGQVLLIVGGTGSFQDATGRVAVAGQEVGGLATYTGHVCIQPQP